MERNERELDGRAGPPPHPDDAKALAPPRAASGTAWAPARVRWALAVVSAIAGLLATVGGPEPTGGPSVDLVLVASAVAGVTWLGAAALRWDAAMLNPLAGILSLSPGGALVGVGAAVIGFAVPVSPSRRSLLNAVLIGVALNIAARSQLDIFLGSSTLVALVLAGYVGVVGFRRRSRVSRRVVLTTIAGFGVLAVAATCALAFFGFLAADDLREGNRLTKRGLEELGDGDIDSARATFADAAAAFESAESRLATPLTAPASLIPVLAQHHRVATDLSAEAADAAQFLVGELQDVDLDALSVIDGQIDVAAVEALQSPLLAIELRIETLQASILALDSQWLLPPVATRLDDFADDAAQQRQRSDDALSIAIAAPALLGADEPRTYFIGFTTPSEARGTGGFMGNWAEMTVTDGRIEMTRFGRSDDLNDAGDPATRRFPTGDAQGFDQWLSRYGPYNLSSGPDGTTGTEPWKNINMSPDVATTGRAIASLYPQSGGGTLDGVFLMDVYTLSRLLRFTGPIALPEGHVVDGEPYVTADNAASFLLKGQYDVTKVDTRADVLEDISQTVVDTLLSSALPSPPELIDALGPMVDQGRLVGWAARRAEQEIFEQMGMAGTLSAPADGDGVAVVFNNAVGNKIDYYLDAAAAYDVVADEQTATATAQLELTMTNNAPDVGEPGYVIGNPIGLPTGTNRTWVSIFTRLPVADVLLNGEPVVTESGAEAGYFVTSVYVLLPAGSTSTLTMDLGGPIGLDDGYSLVTRTPPAVAPVPLTVDATLVDADGRAHQTIEEILDPGTATVVARR